MDEVLLELIRFTADRTMMAIVAVASSTIEEIEKKHGKEKADALQGYVIDAAMGAAQQVAEVFLTEYPGMPRAAELEPVAKLAAERVEERLGCDYLPQLKVMMGVSDESN